LRWIHGREHVVLAEQYAAAGRALTAELARCQPSIDCPHIHAAQPGNLTFRQELLVGGHDRSPSASRSFFTVRAALPGRQDDRAKMLSLRGAPEKFYASVGRQDMIRIKACTRYLPLLYIVSSAH
jgi:hypothetical protein